jgi:hypothetical protein
VPSHASNSKVADALKVKSFDGLRQPLTLWRCGTRFAYSIDKARGAFKLHTVNSMMFSPLNISLAVSSVMFVSFSYFLFFLFLRAVILSKIIRHPCGDFNLFGAGFGGTLTGKAPALLSGYSRERSDQREGTPCWRTDSRGRGSVPRTTSQEACRGTADCKPLMRRRHTSTSPLQRAPMALQHIPKSRLMRRKQIRTKSSSDISQKRRCIEASPDCRRPATGTSLARVTAHLQTDCRERRHHAMTTMMSGRSTTPMPPTAASTP